MTSQSVGKWTFGELKNGDIRICNDCGEVTLEDEMHLCNGGQVDKNPLKQIEDKEGFKDLGRTVFFMWKGMLEEGASREEMVEAMSVWLAAMNKNSDEEDKNA